MGILKLVHNKSHKIIFIEILIELIKKQKKSLNSM